MILKQQRDGWCGPAALSFALLKLGKKVSQEQIAKDLHVGKNGIDPKPLVDYIKSHGFTAKEFSDKDPKETINVLSGLVKRGHAVLVDYLAGNTNEDGHYVVFQGKQGNKILVWDPQYGENKPLSQDYFISHWKDFTSHDTMFKNWAVSISPKGKPQRTSI